MTTDLEQKIRERAYQIWEQEGHVHGRADQHWILAELELTGAASSSVIETPVTTAEPAKKGRRAAAAKTTASARAATPRRRRPAATLQ
jgi:hypothetical protein